MPGAHAICRLNPDDSIPSWATPHGFFSITRSAEELSVVCDEAAVPRDIVAQRGFRGIAVRGPIAFDAIGILANLSGALAAASVSVLAISTYDTDYLFVRGEDLQRAVRALRESGHTVAT
jgi:hypothetical protein